MTKESSCNIAAVAYQRLTNVAREPVWLFDEVLQSFLDDRFPRSEAVKHKSWQKQ